MNGMKNMCEKNQTWAVGVSGFRENWWGEKYQNIAQKVE